MNSRILVLTGVALSGLALCLTPASAQLLGPTPYLRAADSPFVGTDFSGGYFYLEDFEDSALNTPGVTSTTGGSVLGPGTLTDSVDADDGVLDGSGTAGHSFYASGTNRFTFAFSATTLGVLPTHVGIVWTDVGQTTGTTGVGQVQFEAFDAASNSLGVTTATLGDGNANGGTAEDRFFGTIHNGGVSRIEITMPSSVDWEVDHLQYGVVPAPDALFTACLGVLPGAGVLMRRKRRNAEK